MAENEVIKRFSRFEKHISFSHFSTDNLGNQKNCVESFVCAKTGLCIRRRCLIFVMGEHFLFIKLENLYFS